MIAYRKPRPAYSPTALQSQAGPRQASGRSRAIADGRIPWALLAIILAHVPFAFFMQRVPVIAKVHSFAVLGVGLWFALYRGRLLDVACLAAYIVGSEVLWRMCGGGFFWEFGKYGFAVVLMAALFRKGSRAFDLVATSYFLLLLPAVALTMVGSSLSSAKNNLSFYLSGPLALAIGVSFFTRLRLSPLQLRSLLLAAVAPVLGAAALCYGATFGADDIDFGTGSNFAASGGFGPNQVSAALGFGIVATVLCLWLTPVSKLIRLFLLGAVLLFVAQALLTLSRTGLWLAAISCVLAGVQLARSPRQRLGLILSAVTIGLFCRLIVFPAVEELSGGAVSRRFQNTSDTGRENIVKADFQVWARHPLFGVGVGMSRGERIKLTGDRHASHTEYVRMLSEHGLLGLISFCLLFYIMLRAYRSAQTLENKVLAVAAITFGLLFMLVSATRLVVPAFMLSLACVRLEQPQVTLKRSYAKKLANASGMKIPLRPQPHNLLARNRIHGTG